LDGEIVVVRTPEKVADYPTSHTGRHLKQVLAQPGPGQPRLHHAVVPPLGDDRSQQSHVHQVDGRTTLITDLGGEPAASFASTGLSLNGATPKFGTLEDGRHWVISNSGSNSSLYLYDWQSNSRKIESFQLANSTYNFQ
jgi:hypothetical protein